MANCKNCALIQRCTRTDGLLFCSDFLPKITYCKDCVHTSLVYSDCCVCKLYGVKELEDFCSNGEQKLPPLTAKDIIAMTPKEFNNNRERIIEFIKTLKGK